ncbi:hypothetical protein N826_08870 [Skermanella aerolata KACC 11604]|nr:hypothetical protein N826_08870 [Skermanella aerolata KACC 11604]
MSLRLWLFVVELLIGILQLIHIILNYVVGG